MNILQTLEHESDFMLAKLPILLHRYALSCYQEGPCIEYFINTHDSNEPVSYSLVFSKNPVRKDLHISRFHPELCHQPDSKYLSAACFYLLVHHCANTYSLDNTWHISLETIQTTNDVFYKRLKDFDFHINRLGVGNNVELISTIIRSTVDTSMIKTHIFKDGEIPFLK